MLYSLLPAIDFASMEQTGSDKTYWSLFDSSEASSNHHIAKSLIGYNTVKIIVGSQAQTFIVPEDIFHHYITGFKYEFQKREFYGQEKSLCLLQEDPDIFEVLAKRMCGNMDVYEDQYLVNGVRCPVQELTCFKIFILAAKLEIWELIDEAIENLGECLRGGKWPVTVQAVRISYDSLNAHMEVLKAILAWGAMEEWFADGRATEGWKDALGVVALFDKEVRIAMGCHLMKCVHECTLDRCYFHKPEKKLCEKAETTESF